ncbi:MAG: peptide chain release factor 1 [Lentisphaerae bacterium]|nr:peptide chain release factor 1 [Lentisphaerota bacterium]
MYDQSFIDELTTELAEFEKEMSESAASGEQSRFKTAVQAHGRLKKIVSLLERCVSLKTEIEEYESLLDGADEELQLMADVELPTLRSALQSAEREVTLSLIPPDPNDNRNTILEIRAGTGGDEAALFAADLFRMYSRYAENNGWKTEIIDMSMSDIGGCKEVVFSIQGNEVHKRLQFEGGTHRVQRVPTTEASGRIHTSAATVAVLPEAEDVDEILIKSEDLRIDVYRASGAGGQHVNKTDSAVRITHLPTGIIVQSQDDRSQHKNKDKCMRVLRSKLLVLKQTEEKERLGDTRRTQVGSGDRSERIRTYNFPQNRLTDHRINLTLYSLDKIIDGDLNEMIDSLLEDHMAESMEKHKERRFQS